MNQPSITHQKVMSPLARKRAIYIYLIYVLVPLVNYSYLAYQIVLFAYKD